MCSCLWYRLINDQLYSTFSSSSWWSPIIDNPRLLSDNLAQGDRYFRSFFNWSISNQFILVGIIIAEIVLLLLYGKQVGEHFWILATDTFVILLEVFFLRHFRKRMMDLEMDDNVVIPGKIFFVNLVGALSTIQTIESDKIKTVQSAFPNKIASFFNFWTINVLTEGDTQAMMGTMSMYYVTNPDGVVASIHDSRWEIRRTQGKSRSDARRGSTGSTDNSSSTQNYQKETRSVTHSIREKRYAMYSDKKLLWL